MAYFKDDNPDIVFGPVPSRRLGRSLGLNNIPPKICTYSCAYCQVGRTSRLQVERDPFYSVEDFSRSVEARVAQLKKRREPLDYLTFVPDGEPTLDVNLGLHLQNLLPFEIPLAVISNGSLLWQEGVRNDLQHADWCSVKIDTVNASVWHGINRPHGVLSLSLVLQGVQEFSREYRGDLVTETMLVQGVNDSADQLQQTAKFVADLNPSVAYISAPTRPPAESWVRLPDMEVMNTAYHIFSEVLDSVEFLIDYEGDQFASSDNAEQDILSITSVHPMRRSAIQELLKDHDGQWRIVEKLLQQEKLVEMEYEGQHFYLRNLQAK